MIPNLGNSFPGTEAMNTVRNYRVPRTAIDDIRALLSLREATLLAEVPEAKIRKDIETGVLPPIRRGNAERLLFRWADVYVFAAVYKGDLLPGGLRRKAFEAFESLLEPAWRRQFYQSLGVEALTAATCPRLLPRRLFAPYSRLKLGGYVFMDVEQMAKDVAPRVAVYAEGLSRIEEREGVLGGEAVFRNTRLSVRHIGKMHAGGETVENIIEDYPYLHRHDIAFARLYWQAHPAAGRPRRTEEADFAGNPSAR
jgi:uncharacterized protein (DUF433 family)